MKNLIRKAYFKLFKKRWQHSRLKKLRNKEPLRLVIGSGYTMYDGWIVTDIDMLNIVKEEDWLKYFKPSSISSVLAEHVFEHLNESDTNAAVRNIFHFLKPGGIFRIAVPDGFHSSREYIDYVKPGGTGAGADDHKILYTYKSLGDMLTGHGFNVKLLEYFDENQKFHFNPWSVADGKIIRSALNDHRNTDGTLGYSSLIIDAVK